MVEFEFSLEQSLQYEDAVESMFNLLDFFADSDSFDEIEWDPENDAAFVANDDMEVELVLNERSIDVFVAIHAHDLSKHEIRSNLTEDIGRFFGTRSTRGTQSHRRNWREEGARSRDVVESSDTGRSRRQSSGRFGRPQLGAGSSAESGPSRRSARSSDSTPIESRTKARPQALPSRREEEEEVAPAKEKPSARSSSSSVASERKAPAPLQKAPESLEAKSAEKSAEKPETTKKPPHGLSAKPAVPAEAQPTEKKEEGGGSWFWWILLLILIGGGIALYMSPLWPLAK